jgi:hypothetical protein
MDYSNLSLNFFKLQHLILNVGVQSVIGTLEGDEGYERAAIAILFAMNDSSVPYDWDVLCKE